MNHMLEEAIDLGAIPMGGSMLTDEQVAKLKAPLAANRVRQRSQAGRSLSYIEGYDVIDTANDIFGFEGWSYHVKDIQEVIGGDRPLYQAIVVVTVGNAVRSDVGLSAAANGTPDSRDTAIKGAVTDAMKRAFRSFGAQFGNSLYDKDGPELSAPRCEKHGVDLKRGATGKWGHLLEDGKTACFGEAA
jgi:DNA recombination protein Rad52